MNSEMSQLTGKTARFSLKIDSNLARIWLSQQLVKYWEGKMESLFCKTLRNTAFDEV